MGQAIIDYNERGRDNEVVKKMVRANNLTPNKFWVGDVVKYTIETRSKVLEKDTFLWDNDVETHKVKPNTPITIKAIHKHDIYDTPWWYLCECKEIKRNIWFVEEGLLPAKPSYSPKQIKRTLESHNSKEEAKEITILIRNLEEFEMLYDVLKQTGYKILDAFKIMIQKRKEPINIFINLINGEISQSNLNNYQGKWTDSSTYDGVWERELTINDLPYIKRILEAGRIVEEVPSYAPKKIIRKLDESTEIPSYMPEIAPILTTEQQREIYKLGDIVIVRPDAFDYFNDVDEGDMSKFFGKKVKIVEIRTGKDQYGDDVHQYHQNIGSDDLLLTVKSAEDNFPNTDRWYWLYRCLYSPKTAVPTYKPRKNIRSLDESVKLDYLPDVPPLLTPNQQRQQYKIGDVVYIRPDAFDYFYDVNPDMQKWLGKYGTITEIILVEDIYDSYDDRGKGMHYDDLLLTLQLSDDTNTYFWFYRCLVNLEFAKPSYKPRVIDRSIEESFKSDYDISPEKYQEKFGKISPASIPIEDIEEFYNIRFEDYCNDLYPELNESPDSAALIDDTLDGRIFPFSVNGKYLNWDHKGAHGFGYYKNKMYVSPEGKGHGSMGPEDERKNKYFNRLDFKYAGRFWKNEKLISFWVYPPKEELDKILVDLTDVTGINFKDKDWKVEVFDKDNKPYNISTSDYAGSEEISPEELARQHVMSPLLKPKREVPDGYGSRNPKYHKNRAWQIASLTNESKWYTTFRERREQLSKGEYDCIAFNATYEEREKLFEYLKDIQIIGDIDRAQSYHHFVILTKPVQYLEPFLLYNYLSITDIRQHMHDSFHIPMDKISPVMTFVQFKKYMDRYMVKSAKDMYTPKKIDRSI